MRIYYEYPMATEENMKTIQDAINAGMDIANLLDNFPEEMVWDCVVVLSGNKDTTWQVFDWMDGNLQTRVEDWQIDYIDDYIATTNERSLR